MKDDFEVIGNQQLCAWRVTQGRVWMQTREPDHAHELARRADSRLVARGVAGGYLRIYEFQHSISWARTLVQRYTAISGQPPAQMSL